ncbi:SDR family oxidoreductase [Sphingobium sp. RSMS]|uniref:SDR family NAD(P)-dependent oxidoreductase n=1 Tax=Sphingobium sp. RSMS TaxID=520734 RepID=UPI001484EA9D|nr:SDR family NAD(P)-dependent oxidoreductase [Sphingobium sp. RSMS]UXC91099.1 SDR family oxidoreductase [Sphingobium sp. RSMS]
MNAEDAHDRGTGGIILIGPGRHFGLELVRRFAAERRRVAVISATTGTLDNLRSDLGEDAEAVIFAQADVSDVDAFSQTLSFVADELGCVEGLIYNPKVSIKASVLTTRPEELQQAMTVNLTGAMVAVQTLLPYLEQTRGRVILTGGGYKDTPHPDKFSLSAGKANMHTLYKALRDPLRLRGVSVTTVIIDGAVRRHAIDETSSDRLADFFWSVFEGEGVRAHRFPGERPVEQTQLRLFA